MVALNAQQETTVQIGIYIYWLDVCTLKNGLDQGKGHICGLSFRFLVAVWYHMHVSVMEETPELSCLGDKSSMLIFYKKKDLRKYYWRSVTRQKLKSTVLVKLNCNFAQRMESFRLLLTLVSMGKSSSAVTCHVYCHLSRLLSPVMVTVTCHGYCHLS